MMTEQDKAQAMNDLYGDQPKTFSVELPNGTVLDGVPEGTTKAQIADKLKAKGFNFDANLKPETNGPAERKDLQPEDQSLSRTALDQGLQGATFGYSDEVMDRMGAHIASLITGEDYDSLLKQARQMSADRLKQQAEQNPKTAIASNIAGALLTSAAGASTKAGAAIADSLGSGNLAARMGKAAIVGAASNELSSAGAAEDGKQLEEAGKAALPGAAFGAAIPLAAAGLKATKDAILPRIEGPVKELAQRARDLGIPLRMDQVSPTKFRTTVQKVSQELPLSGSDAFEETQRQAFTKAVAGTIGQNADNLGPDTINNFLTDAKQKFSNVLTGKPIVVEKADITGLDNIAQQAQGNITRDYAKIVSGKVKGAIADLQGQLDGDKLASLRSKLLDDMTSVSGDAKGYIGKIIDKVDDIAAKNLSGADVKKLAQARLEWRNFRTIEPLLEKSTDGTINPTQLLNRVSASKYIKASRLPTGQDDLVDLARIGKEFLPKLGGSDTAQKVGLITAGGIGATALQNPLLAVKTAGLTGATLAANRGFQAANTSQRLIDAALKQGAPMALPGQIPLAAIVSGAGVRP
jgi:hypothetical protein